jgi:hypothetical protein
LKRPVLIGISVVGAIGVLVLFISQISPGDAEPVASNTPPVVTSPPIPRPEPKAPQPETPPTIPPQPEPEPEPEPANTLPASLQEGLVAYYPFNGNANDESGNGHHGEVQGAALTADRHGVPVSAYGFDGTKDMINLGDQWGDFGTDPFTIALWVYRKTTSNCDAFVSKGKYGKSAQWNLVTANPTDNGMTPRNQIRFHLTSTGSNGNTIHSTSQVGTKTWHHVVIQRNTRGLNMFIDGYLDASLTCSPLNADSSVPVRCGFVDTWQPNEYRMNGDIDDVRIYNRALSAAEVKSLYDYESTPPVPPTAPAIESITNTIGMTLNKIPAGYLLEHIP